MKFFAFENDVAIFNRQQKEKKSAALYKTRAELSGHHHSSAIVTKHQTTNEKYKMSFTRMLVVLGIAISLGQLCNCRSIERRSTNNDMTGIDDVRTR